MEDELTCKCCENEMKELSFDQILLNYVFWCKKCGTAAVGNVRDDHNRLDWYIPCTCPPNDEQRGKKWVCPEHGVCAS